MEAAKESVGRGLAPAACNTIATYWLGAMEVAKESVGRGLAPAVCYYQRLITLRRETSPRPTGVVSYTLRIAECGKTPWLSLWESCQRS